MDITLHVKTAAVESGVLNGQMTIFCPHTTASVRLNHNEELFNPGFYESSYRLAPVDQSYAHDLFEVRRNVGKSGRAHERTCARKKLFARVFGNLNYGKGEIILGKQQSIFFC